ncbi:MAG TPA: HI0074 family nucleotidyltransferase substrate-binding subunit [Terriglobia bacterium]|nr:HI0074 family nucleotidyltransferase substrate-binding subunit [Terriglobia bacterium]
MTEAVFNSFSQSIERLAEVLDQPRTVITRDSAIKRFELTYELAWKSAKVYLVKQGIVCQSPRDCFMEVFRLGLISDNPLWLKMIEDRNLSVHTYNEKLAEDLYARLRGYLLVFTELKSSLGR